MQRAAGVSGETSAITTPEFMGIGPGAGVICLIWQHLVTSAHQMQGLRVSGEAIVEI